MHIKDYIQVSIDTKQKILNDKNILTTIQNASNAIIKAYKNGKKVLTAGNDYGYDKSFSRQIQANANEGDIFIGISTSGNSKNIINAILEAKKKKVITVGFTGESDCEMDNICDYLIKVPSKSTPIIQESHIMIGHIICAIVEEAIFRGEGLCLSEQKHH